MESAVTSFSICSFVSVEFRFFVGDVWRVRRPGFDGLPVF